MAKAEDKKPLAGKRPKVPLSDLDLMSFLQQEETGFIIVTREGKMLCEDGQGDLEWLRIDSANLRHAFVFDTLQEALNFNPTSGTEAYSTFHKSVAVVLSFKSTHTLETPPKESLKRALRKQALAKLTSQERQALGFGNDEVE